MDDRGFGTIFPERMTPEMIRARVGQGMGSPFADLIGDAPQASGWETANGVLQGLDIVVSLLQAIFG